MSEAELIEIARRRRKLEDLVEIALAAILEAYPQAGEPGEFKTSIDAACEACRDDMNAMQDEIRRMQDKCSEQLRNPARQCAK
jgi:hypothetical protein